MKNEVLLPNEEQLNRLEFLRLEEMPETRYLHAHSQSSFISRPSKEFS